MNASTRIKLLGMVASVGAAIGVAAPVHALSDYGGVVATYTGRDVIAEGGGVFRFSRNVNHAADTFDGVLVTNNPVNTFIGMCIELGETVNGQENTYVVRDVADAPIDSVGVMGSDRGADVAKLVQLAFGGFLANALNVGAPVLAAQIALWEIAVDRAAGPYSLLGGDYSHEVVSAAGLQAKQWLDAIWADRGVNALQQARSLYALTNPDRQDMLVQTPIPAAVWLLGSGLLGLLGIGRRRRSAAA